MNAGDHDIDTAAKRLAVCAGSLEQRRRIALFIGGMRGHAISASAWAEQPYGLVQQCRRCEMVLKVPREQAGPEGIEGRAVEFDCPARTR